MKEKTQKETLREKLFIRKKVMGLKVPDVNLILSLLKSKDKNIKLFNSCQKKYCIRFKTKKKYFDRIVDSSNSTFDFKTNIFSNLEGNMSSNFSQM